MEAFLHDLHFVRPLWFLASVPAGVLFLLLLSGSRRSSGWQKTINPSLLTHLLEGKQGKKQQWPLYLLLAAWLASCLALAGPVWEKLPQPVQKKEDALVIIQDLSLSFYARDLSPSRLVRAQQKIIDILQQRKEGTTALVVYSGDAHIVSPLTDDSKTIAAMVSALSPRIMPVYGSNVAESVRLALDLLKDAGVSSGKLLLITDEVEEEDAAAVEKILRGKNIVLSVLGIGTEEGGPIPKPDGGFLKDADGKIIVPRLNSPVLRKMATKIGGRYSTITLDDRDIEYLLAAGFRLPTDNVYRQIDREFDQWRETGYWVLVLILPVALLAFRRGWIVVCIVSVFLTGGECRAFSWQDAWQRKDQQAARALQEKDFARAAELFETPDWKGVAQYRAGNFVDAADAFGDKETPDNLYNRGTALAKAGRYEEALKAFDAALKRDPDMADAKYNRELVAKALHEKEQQQKPQRDEQSAGKQGEQQEQEKSHEQNRVQQGKAPQQEVKEPDRDQVQPGEQQQVERQGTGPGEHKRQDEGGKLSRRDEEGSRQESRQRREKRQLEGEKGMDDSARDANNESGRKQQVFTGEHELPAGRGRQDENAGTNKVLAPQAEDDKMDEEEQQALNQWLRQVPDDPGGLLRRKFEYESRVNRGGQAPDQKGKIW